MKTELDSEMRAAGLLLTIPAPPVSRGLACAWAANAH